MGEGDGAFIGVGSHGGFKEGRRFRGLLFGGSGDLFDGDEILRKSWGEQVKAGSVISVLLELGDPLNVAVTFWQNDRCLGKSYEGTRKRPGDAMYPVVSATIGARIAIRFPGPCARIERGREICKVASVAGAHPAEGHWHLEHLFLGPELHEFPLKYHSEDPYTLHVRPQLPADNFALVFRFVNTIVVLGTTASSEKYFPFEQLTVEAGPSTNLMTGPESTMELEEKLKSNLQTVFKWMVSERGLVLVGPTIEMNFVPNPRAAAAEQPVSVASLRAHSKIL